MTDETETRTRDYPPVLDVEPQAMTAPPPRQQPDLGSYTSERPVQRPQVVRAIGDSATEKAAVAQAQVRVIVRHSEELGALFGALAKAQGQFEDLERTREARIEGKTSGVKFTFEYETLADVIEATKKGLSENGLCVMQFPFPERGQLTLRTMLGHSSGQWIYNDMTATIAGNDPQSAGSGITYLDRYARKSILGIAAAYDDDDGQAATQAPPRGAPQPAQRVSQQTAQPARPAAPTPPVAAPVAEAERLLDASKGLIVAVEHRASPSGDVWYVKLDTDYAAATKVVTLAQTATALKDAGRKVRLVTRQPSKPGYALNLTEIEVLEDQAATS